MILNGSLRKYDPSEFTWDGEIKFTLEEKNYKRLKDLSNRRRKNNNQLKFKNKGRKVSRTIVNWMDQTILFYLNDYHDAAWHDTMKEQAVGAAQQQEDHVSTR